jgi:type II secretory pathway pseudopilin PulG
MFPPDRSNRRALASRLRGRLPVRAGLTLMETLVAIFIMAIGMLALLTLFPLGALRMEQAIRDERCAQAGVQATELAKILDLANDPLVRQALVDPNALPSGGYSPGAGITAGPSKAVLVDPLASTTPTAIQYVDSTNNLARVASNYWSNYYDLFTITDDVVFKLGTGIPRQFGTNSTAIGREIRFSWSYLLQQPQVQNPGITNYSACIYNRRPLVASSLDYVLPSAQINIAGNSISFNDPNATKQIFPGQWVLDATIAKGVGATPGASGPLVPMANFYRITNVRVTSTGTVLDLQTPVRGYANISTSVYPAVAGGNASQPAAVCIVQDSLVEVIDIGPLR